MKILFLYTELAGYFVSCLHELAPRCESIHIVSWPVNKEAPFQFMFPDNVTIYERNEYSQDQLLQLVAGIAPDKIVCSGWVDKGYVKVCRAFKGKVPTIMSMDNQWHGTAKQQVMRLIAPFYLHRNFSHAWVPGDPQKQYALKLGFKNERIATGFYSADTALFSPLSKCKQESLPHRFIYVGRYIKAKGLDMLFAAFIELQQETPNDWELWCVGTGELFEQRPMHPKIVHHGFVQPGDLPSYLQQTGVFVLPSLFEPWGVVVHEMAAAGMPMVVSSAVGAASRFVEEGKNGYLFQSGNKESLKKALKLMMEQNDDQLMQMGAASSKIGLSHTPWIWAEILMGIKL
jgi:glycosyltransferase involved in cell wall biosynthesis